MTKKTLIKGFASLGIVLCLIAVMESYAGKREQSAESKIEKTKAGTETQEQRDRRMTFPLTILVIASPVT